MVLEQAVSRLPLATLNAGFLPPLNCPPSLQLAKCGKAPQFNMIFAIAGSIYLICLSNVSKDLENEKLKSLV